MRIGQNEIQIPLLLALVEIQRDTIGTVSDEHFCVGSSNRYEPSINDPEGANKLKSNKLVVNCCHLCAIQICTIEKYTFARHFFAPLFACFYYSSSFRVRTTKKKFTHYVGARRLS